MPYQPFVEALRHYAAHAGDLSAARRRGARPARAGARRRASRSPRERENRRYRLFEAVAALLGRAAAERPLLLVVEDLHWAGQPTLLLLRHVVRRLHGAPLTGARHPARRRGRPRRRRPRGCSPTSAASTSSSGSRSRGSRRPRRPSSSATPSSPAACTGAPPATRSSSRRCCAASPRRPTSRPACPRASRTSSRAASRGSAPDTVETLTAAAVLGRDFRPRHARGDGRAAGGGAARARSRRRCARASCARTPSTSTASRSPTRSCARRSTTRPPHARRARLHLRAGHALEAAGAPPGELAHHFFQAREVGGAEAAVAHGAEPRRARPWPRTPTRRRRGTSSRRSRRSSRRRLQRAELLIALGDVRWQASEPGARAAFDEAAELARRQRRARGARPRRARRRRPLLHADRAPTRPTSSGSRRRSRALGDADGALRARLLARLAEHLALADAGDRPARLGAEAVAMARRAGDEGALAAALMGRHAALLGHRARRPSAWRRSTRRSPSPTGSGRPRSPRSRCTGGSTTSSSSARSAPPRPSHTRLEALARELHQPLYSHAALAWRGEWAHLAGRLEEAERIHRESLRIAEAAGAPEARGFFLTQLFAVRRVPGPAGRAARADRAPEPRAAAPSA